MGRFSKLETSPSPEDRERAAGAGGDESSAETLGVRRRPKRPGDPAHFPADSLDYDAAYYRTEADKLFYGGDYQKALRNYSRALERESSNPEPWLGQVRCLLALRQHKEALIWVKRALEMFPEDARIASLQGLAYAQHGMAARGLACSDFAMSRPGGSTADPLVWAVRGAILALGGQPGNAESCFDKAMVQKSREDWRTPMSIGVFLIEQRRWSKAAEFFEAAAKIEATNDHLWERLGYARERLGLGSAALEAYQAALHLNARNKAADAGMARVGHSSVFTRVFRRLFG